MPVGRLSDVLGFFGTTFHGTLVIAFKDDLQFFTGVHREIVAFPKTVWLSLMQSLQIAPPIPVELQVCALSLVLHVLTC